MDLLRSASARRRALGSLTVAAGGFSVGGLVMTLAFPMISDSQDMRVVLQNSTGPVLVPQAEPSSLSASPDIPDSPPPAPASTPSPTVTRAAAAPRKAAVTPHAARTTAKKPPAVHSSGS